MKLKPNDVVRWKGGDGYLKSGDDYLVDKIRTGKRGQEFTLKDFGGRAVCPAIYWEWGLPFSIIKYLGGIK